jgi:hypothetical protein
MAEYVASAHDNFVVYQRLFYGDDTPSVIDTQGQVYTHESGLYFFDFYRWALQPTWLDSSKIPHMVFMAKGRIPQLENLVLDPMLVEHLNQRGLEIYLYEVSTFTLDAVPDIQVKSHPDKQTTLIDTVIDRCHGMLLDFHPDDYHRLRCYELHSIDKFAETNDLKNVRVYTCHYNISKYLQQHYPHIKIRCKDLHLASMVDFPKEDQYPIFLNQNLSDLIDRKFVSPNWRYHTARHLAMLYLNDKSGYYSWYFQGPFESDVFDTDRLSHIIAQQPLLDSVTPLMLDITQTTNKIDGSVDFMKYPGGLKTGSPGDYRIDWAYLKSFCAVVTESIYAQPMAMFSEKTMNAVKLGRPFVLVAPPNTLAYMKEYGFRTFEDFWDESYDSEPDHTARMLKIFDVLDYIDSKDIDELQEIYKSMKDILEHNANNLTILKKSKNTFL